MKWRKLGKIFCADGQQPWMKTHASNPVAEYENEDIFRVYFSCRNQRNQSSVGYVDLDINRPQKILDLSPEPVLAPGEPGTFDDSGTSMGCLVHLNSRRFLYYIGWNLGVTVPWRNSIGLAISNGPNQPFVKISSAPIMDRDHNDPFSLSYPWVAFDGPTWRMWYGSNLRWGKKKEEMEHLLKYAESDDGIYWRRDGKISVGFKSPTEYAIARPCVRKDNNRYRMWYSYRGESYRIGYAESHDGKSWTRLDEQAGIDVSPSGWDSEMIEYPHVFDHNGDRFMLYNGNGYGRTGFGLAILEGN